MDYKFQYYIWTEKIEDTHLISREEAYQLLDEYKQSFKECLNSWKEPSLAVWSNCTETNFWIAEFELDYREIIRIGSIYYKKISL